MKVKLYITKHSNVDTKHFSKFRYHDQNLTFCAASPWEMVKKFEEKVREGRNFKCLTYTDWVYRSFMDLVSRGIISEPRLIIVDEGFKSIQFERDIDGRVIAPSYVNEFFK